MRRSSSGARVSEGDAGAGLHDGMALPTYDPQSAAGQRESARARALERAVHCIPLVLLLCALLLWLSASVSPPVRLGKNPVNSSSLRFSRCVPASLRCPCACASIRACREKIDR